MPVPKFDHKDFCKRDILYFYKVDPSELARVISKNLSAIFYQRSNKLFKIRKILAPYIVDIV
jgi:hypothetical protein